MATSFRNTEKVSERQRELRRSEDSGTLRERSTQTRKTYVLSISLGHSVSYGLHMGPHQPSSRGPLRCPLSGYRGQDLGGLSATIRKLPLHKEFQGKATTTKPKLEKLLNHTTVSYEIQRVSLFWGRGETEGRGHPERSIF